MPLADDIVLQLKILRNAIDGSLRDNTRNCRLVDLKARLQLGRFIYEPERYSLWHVHLWFIKSTQFPKSGPGHNLFALLPSPAEGAITDALKTIQPSGLKKYWLFLRHYLFRSLLAVWSVACLGLMEIFTIGLTTGWVQIGLPILLVVLMPFICVFLVWVSEKMAYEVQGNHFIKVGIVLTIAALTLPLTYTASAIFFGYQLTCCVLLVGVVVDAIIGRARRLYRERTLALVSNDINTRNALIEDINDTQLLSPHFEFLDVSVPLPDAAVVEMFSNRDSIVPTADDSVPMRLSPDFWSPPASQVGPLASGLLPGGDAIESKSFGHP